MPSGSAQIGPDTIENLSLLRLHEIWRAKRNGREFPARRDFDPAELKFILGSLLILDVQPGPRFRFRLHGTKLVMLAGYDMTGRDVEDLPVLENRRVLATRCRLLLDERRPMAIRMSRPLEGRRYNYEALWLPLASDGSSIDMLMCGLIYLDDWQHARPEPSESASGKALVRSG